MSRFAAIAFAAAFLAAPAAAQEVTLAPGEAAVVRIGGSAGIARERAEWTPRDVAVARHLAGLTPPDQPVPEPSAVPDGLPPGAPVQRGVVRLRFLSIAGQHAMLIVENGYDRGLVYRARMTHDGRTQSTDVCLVAPGQRGYEHWPHPIDALALSDMELVPWRPGDPQPCR